MAWNGIERNERLRKAVWACYQRGILGTTHRKTGTQARLAEHFGVSRQRVSQVIRDVLGEHYAVRRVS